MTQNTSIQIKFFAQIRETLGCEALEYHLNGVTEISLDALRNLLCQQGKVWTECLQQEKVLMAVNHELVNASFIVTAGDEVAFFPPVTGG